MKKFLSILLTLCVLLTLCAVPASAASSGGLKTYYCVTGDQYRVRNGLKYDFHLFGIPVRKPTDSGWDWSRDNFSDLTFTQEDGVLKFGAALCMEYEETSAWAEAIDYPIVKCWVDGALVSDGVTCQRLYNELSSRWGYPFISCATTFLSTTIDGELALTSSGDWSIDDKVTYALDTSQLTPGPHTIRFSINPDYLSEEENRSNNEATRTIYIRGAAPEAPAAPVILNRTDTTLTVETVDGQEYSIDGGSTWQTSGTFPGLTPDRAYSITARIAETGTAAASSASAALSVRTKKAAPDPPPAPRLWSRTATTITIY